MNYIFLFTYYFRCWWHSSPQVTFNSITQNLCAPPVSQNLFLFVLAQRLWAECFYPPLQSLFSWCSLCVLRPFEGEFPWCSVQKEKGGRYPAQPLINLIVHLNNKCMFRKLMEVNVFELLAFCLWAEHQLMPISWFVKYSSCFFFNIPTGVLPQRMKWDLI